MALPEARRPTLMVVHAHPDDEASQTGGTLARYAADGFRTVLVTCTDGSQGDDDLGVKAGHRDHRPARVAALRSRELEMSKLALGISDLIQLGHPDSGMPEAPGDVDPRAFSRIDGEPVVRQLETLIRRYQPDVIVTYPPDGLSRHPDHIRTHQLTVAAFDHIKEVGGLRPLGRSGARTGRVPKLYYVTASVSRIRSMRARAEELLEPGAWMPPPGIGVEDDAVTTVIDVSAFQAEKLRALAAHASQADAAALLRVFSVPGFQNQAEEYVRAYPAWSGGPREATLFGGIASARGA